MKGGDYALGKLPERLDEWPGETIVLAYTEGRSATTLLQEMAQRDWT